MTNEQLSEWIDDELDAAGCAQVVNGLVRQSAQRETCSLYWLIGDCLRGEAPSGKDLTGSVLAALAAEPTVLAPVARAPRVESSRWLPIAAAVAGVAVAAWMGLSLWSAPLQEAPATIAQQQSVTSDNIAVASAAVPGEPLPDDQSYLMAHQASAMGTPMAGVAQYIRSVNIEQVDRR